MSKTRAQFGATGRCTLRFRSSPTGQGRLDKREQAGPSLPHCYSTAFAISVGRSKGDFVADRFESIRRTAGPIFYMGGTDSVAKTMHTSVIVPFAGKSFVSPFFLYVSRTSRCSRSEPGSQTKHEAHVIGAFAMTAGERRGLAELPPVHDTDVRPHLAGDFIPES
jgi:hypothetical protein